MDLMKGKKGVIFGVSNTHGIAYGIAKHGIPGDPRRGNSFGGG